MRNFLKTDRTTDDETQPDESADTAMNPGTAAPDRDERTAYTERENAEPKYGVPANAEPTYGVPANAEPEYGVPANAGVVDENESAAGPVVDPVVDSDSDLDDDRPQPTFTPASARSASDLPADEPAAAAFPTSEAATAPPADEPVTATPLDEPVATIRADEPAAAPMTSSTATPSTGSTTENDPLLANTELMRASWQQVQAGFVDDPKAAVSDAADLIDVTVQALVETLQQRQRQLRDMSGSGTANGVSNSAGYGSAASGDVPDTEQLRLVMQRYRSLFNQLVNS
jgi:hypothetical protein